MAQTLQSPNPVKYLGLSLSMVRPPSIPSYDSKEDNQPALGVPSFFGQPDMAYWVYHIAANRSLLWGPVAFATAAAPSLGSPDHHVLPRGTLPPVCEAQRSDEMMHWTWLCIAAENQEVNTEIIPSFAELQSFFSSLPI